MGWSKGPEDRKTAAPMTEKTKRTIERCAWTVLVGLLTLAVFFGHSPDFFGTRTGASFALDPTVISECGTPSKAMLMCTDRLEPEQRKMLVFDWTKIGEPNRFGVSFGRAAGFKLVQRYELESTQKVAVVVVDNDETRFAQTGERGKE